MRDNLRKLKPNRFEDIIAMNALYRPGPMDSIPKYIKCKNGEEPIYYPHPLLEPILKDTFGVFTYQEQVMQAAQIMAGYSLGSADLLRRAMGKKKASEMAAQRANFVAGAAKKGRRRPAGEFRVRSDGKIFRLRIQQIPFGALCADRLSDRLSEGQLPGRIFRRVDEFRNGQHRQAEPVSAGGATGSRIRLLPPDINRSQPTFSVEAPIPRGREKDRIKPAIRYALAAVKGVGEQAMTELVREREANGRFKDLFDLARRLDAKSFQPRTIREPGQGRGLRMPDPEPGADLCRGRSAAARGEPQRRRAA